MGFPTISTHIHGIRPLFLILSVILVFISTSSPGQEDNYVWRKAYWGMTEQEVLDMFEDEAMKLSNAVRYKTGFSSVHIPQLEIMHEDYEVFFLFDEENWTLVGINIKCKEQNPEETDRIYRDLYEALSEKYGNAYSNDEDPDEELRKKEALWRSGNTNIALTYHHMVGVYTKLVIRYSPI
jgi:hypothetical protein